MRKFHSKYLLFIKKKIEMLVFGFFFFKKAFSKVN